MRRARPCASFAPMLALLLAPALAHAQSQSPIVSMRFDPFVIRTTGETCRLLVQTDPTVAALRVDNYLMKIDGRIESPLELFDDGTHGDAVAHDHVFTVDGISFDLASEPYFAGTPFIQGVSGVPQVFVTYTDGSAKTLTVSYPLVVKQIRSESYVKPRVQPIAGGQRTDYVVQLVVPYQPGVSWVDDTAIAKRYYDLFPDDRDFLVVDDELPQSSMGAAAYSAGVRNTVKGCGLEIFDNGASYGSPARLQQLVHMFATPNGGLLNHELLHRWGVSLAGVGGGDGHWTAIRRPSSGFGTYWGAFKEFIPLSSTTFRAMFNSPEAFVYNDLELYLMGLVGTEAVSWPVQYLTNARKVGSGYDSSGAQYSDFTSDGIANLTLADLVAKYGQRLPAAPDAQKEFRLATVVVYDRLLTEVELAFLDMLVREYGRPSSSWHGFNGFESATGGTGRMTTILPGTSETSVVLLPSSAHAPGANGAFYRTDVSVANVSAADTSVLLKFLGHAVDGTTGEERSLPLWAGHVATYEDVLASAFSRPDDYGALRLSSNRSLVVSSETYTQGFGGTFGQSVPAARATDVFTAGVPRSIPAVREDAAFRTNLMLCNAGSSDVTVDVALVGAGGQVLGEKSYGLAPLGMIQVSRVVRDLAFSGDVASATLVLGTRTPGGSFVAYASVIDNVTNDPRTLLPSGTGTGASWLLPSSAHGPGANGAFYTTDLTVTNLEDRDVTFAVKFLGHDQDGTGGPERTFALGPRRSVTYDDVLATVFEQTAAYGAILVSSPSAALAVLGQTSTPGFGGTFGQSVPAAASDDLVRYGTERTILGIRETASFRTNLILANAAPFALDTDVAMVAPDGTTLARKRYRVPALGMTQLTRVASGLGLGDDVEGARLVLSTPTVGGAFAAYASVIDNVTNDPRTLLAR